MSVQVMFLLLGDRLQTGRLALDLKLFNITIGLQISACTFPCPYGR
jgi:hypothetical protein